MPDDLVLAVQDSQGTGLQAIGMARCLAPGRLSGASMRSPAIARWSWLLIRALLLNAAAVAVYCCNNAAIPAAAAA